MANGYRFALYPRLFYFGHLAIPTYGVFTAIALIAALVLSLQTAKRLALDPNKVWNLGLFAIFTALLGSRLLLIVLHPRDFLAHPFWMLGLVTVRNTGIFFGSIALAICVCMGYILSVGLPLRRTLDCVSPAIAVGLALHSLGAFAAGSDYGTPTNKPWGVVYKHGLSALWSGTPLGVGLHPVQMYEAVLFLALFAVLLFWLPRRQRNGDVAGVFLFSAGLIFYFLDFYRGSRSFLFHESLSVTQFISVIVTLAGATLLLRRKPSAL